MTTQKKEVVRERESKGPLTLFATVILHRPVDLHAGVHRSCAVHGRQGKVKGRLASDAEDYLDALDTTTGTWSSVAAVMPNHPLTDANEPMNGRMTLYQPPM